MLHRIFMDFLQNDVLSSPFSLKNTFERLWKWPGVRPNNKSWEFLWCSKGTEVHETTPNKKQANKQTTGQSAESNLEKQTDWQVQAWVFFVPQNKL